MNSFYVDTCIYLNIWNNESDSNGKNVGQESKIFLEKIKKAGAKIFYSGFILKELLFNLPMETYLEKLEKFENSKEFEKIKLSQSEYYEILELSKDLKISKFDLAHIYLARKTHSVLVTRDKELLSYANQLGISAHFPEEL